MHGNVLTVQVLNGSHTKLKILKFDIRTGERTVLFVEEQDSWVNLHDCLMRLDKVVSKFSGGFLWASEKTGFRHLYLHDKSGACLSPITQGELMVEQIAGVNEAAGLVHFTGTADGPLESHLYCAKLFPEGSSPLQTPQRLTHGKGKHVVVLLCSLSDGTALIPPFEQPFTIPRFKWLQLEPPEIVSVKADDGTVLYGTLYKPDARKFGPLPCRTLISVYSGPGVQLVCDSWVNTVGIRVQYLCNKVILVWKVSISCSGILYCFPNFSAVVLCFHDVNLELGSLDSSPFPCFVIDQILVQSGPLWLAEAGRIGLYGWSYGGYISAMGLVKYSEIFSFAVSGAPVTSWDGYNTFYTEKYMGLPSENTTNYKQSSVMHHADFSAVRVLFKPDFTSSDPAVKLGCKFWLSLRTVLTSK
ncbi:Peptidase S9, prolyl oligopeptidase, catalytic domain [Dillenia turbinata]|uniref:Peptidase S9, prolyl oligopeptidase, catalytic domain n=1 Tax=Dillenia turbinata TaxID=194707 RepID=A0AAN8V3I6_9MAGN